MKVMVLDEKNYTDLDIDYKSRADGSPSVSMLYGRVRITGPDTKKVNTLYLEMKDFFDSKQPFFKSKETIFIFSAIL